MVCSKSNETFWKIGKFEMNELNVQLYDFFYYIFIKDMFLIWRVIEQFTCM